MQKKVNSSLSMFSQFWIIFFPISSYFFYMYVGFNQQICKAIYFVTVPITFLLVFSELRKVYKGRLYSGIVRNIFLLMILSVILSFLFWNQNLILSYRVSVTYLAVLYFFFLIKTKPSFVFIEKTIWFFCALYLILWVYGMLKAPSAVFGLEAESVINDDRGIFRLSILGKGFLILGFFMAISKYISTKKKYWVAVFIILFIVIVMHVIRQVIVISFLVGFYYLLKKNRYLWFWLGVSIVISVFFLNLKIDSNTVVGKLVALSENQLQDQKGEDDNVRIKEYAYYFTEYTKNIFTVVFGNGAPHVESDFGKRELRIKDEMKYYSSDVGYADIYIKLGVAGLMLYGLIFYRVIKQNVPSEYMYAKLFMIYICIANISASWVFHDVIVVCICLYILESCNKKIVLSLKVQ